MKPHWIITGMALLLTACDSPLTLHAASPTTFDFAGFYQASGTAQVEGYMTAIVLDDDNCQTDICDSQLYLHFTVIKTNVNAIWKFLEQQDGNAYAGPYFFGIGCLEGDSIHYQNASDEFGMKEFEINEKTSNAILQSKTYAPIKLQITKLPLSSAMQGSSCYSHFTTIEVAK